MPDVRTAALQGAIHIPGKPAPAIEFAAQELQRYWERMAGVRIPMTRGAVPNTLVIGSSSTTTAPPQNAESFVIDPEPARITLQAGSPRAVLSAVYTLLESLGCRWSLHGPDEEVVPRLEATMQLGRVEHTPRFAVRGYVSDIMTWHYTQPEHLNDRLGDDRTFIDWMGKSGASAFFFIRHPFDTQLTIPELLPDFQRRGIDLEYGGHVMPLLLPRELYREHPDYFPVSPDGTRSDHGNLCTSDAAGLATASAHAVQYVRDYPELSVLHIWGADLWQGGWCHCAVCAPLSVQDQSLRVCNAVAHGLAEAGVARPVCYLAYHDTLEANLTIRPDENVVAELAPRERCYGHALNNPGCVTNRRYAAALERYVDRFDGRVRLFEYYGDAILFFGCSVPLTEVIAADMDYYARLGVPGATMLQFGTYSVWAYPLNFLAFAAATRRICDPATVRREYCARFPQQAGAVAALFAEVEDIMRRVVTYGDIRRPPHAADAARRVLASVETALPRLTRIAAQLAACGDGALAAQAALLRYTQTVLAGVRQQLQHTLAGQPPDAERLYGDALQVIDAVERRFKGLWGSVDLSIIHSYFSVAAQTQ
jgi:Domain of unknown function (DUF4838)